MRIRAALPFVLLAASAAAAKPPADRPGEAAERAGWRTEAVAACIAEQVPAAINDPRVSTNLANRCGCAVDRFMETASTAVLPPVASGRISEMLEMHVIVCEMEQFRDAATASVRNAERIAQDAQPDRPAPSAPAGTDDKPSGNAVTAWFRELSLPRWAWAGLAVFVIGLFLMRRRRDPRRDLLRPPPSLHSSGSGRRPEL